MTTCVGMLVELTAGIVQALVTAMFARSNTRFTCISMKQTAAGDVKVLSSANHRVCIHTASIVIGLRCAALELFV